MATTRISAHVSGTTKERLDRLSRATGMKTGRLIENAILHHMEALRELPTGVIISPRVVLTASSADRIIRRMQQPAEPTEGLRKLIHEV